MAVYAREAATAMGHRASRVISRIAICFTLLFVSSAVLASDVDGRFANSPLRKWFESLRSDKSPCCSDADGMVLADVDWESSAGHYRVRIEGEWWDVPDEALVKGPNLLGRTMVWPVYYRSVTTGKYIKGTRIEIRCFMLGSMS